MTDELPDGWEQATPSLYMKAGKAENRVSYGEAWAFRSDGRWYASKVTARNQFDRFGLPGFDSAVAAMVWYELNH